MFHPIVSLLIKKPDLVADHLSGYAGLIREEATSVGVEVVKFAVAWAIAGVFGLLFLVFTGVALMLWGVAGFQWLLLAVPLVTLAIAVIGAIEGYRLRPRPAFPETRSQLDADMQTLRTLGQGAS